MIDWSKNLFWNVPFQNVALEGAGCRFTAHQSFAFWMILYQKQTSNDIPMAAFVRADAADEVGVFKLAYVLLHASN